MSAATSLLGAASAELPASESTLSPAERLQSSLRGLAIGLALFALAAILGILFASAVFGYSIGALV